MFIVKPYRSKKYLAWVKTLDSVLSHQPGCDAHHLIGHGQGGIGTKVTDIWTFPLTRGEHTELHHMGWKAWEEEHGSQWRFIGLTVHLAILEGPLSLPRDKQVESTYRDDDW